MAKKPLNPTLGQRLRYAFDNTMANGSVALIGWLALASLFVILFAAGIVTFFGIQPEGAEPLGYVEAAWQSLLRTIDAGTMGGDSGWAFRILALGITFAGIFIFSALIGIISTWLDERIENLRKGRSIVLETDHTLILGWSPKVFTIISELVAANSSRKKASIVILADKDKVEMEDEIRTEVPDTGNTRIICRTGSPIDFNDLEITNHQAARSIIVLGSEESANPDAQVVKIILALTHNPNRSDKKYHIIAEMENEDNVDIARVVGKDELEVVVTTKVIARITAQTCRQSGLSSVYTELLDFGGDEIYQTPAKAWANQTYGDVLPQYPQATVIGITRNDGRVMLNPAPSTKITEQDTLLVIAEDDDKIKAATPTVNVQESALVASRNLPSVLENTLVLGWNERGFIILKELDMYVPTGSKATVISGLSPEAISEIEAVTKTFKNLTVTVQDGEPTHRKLLDQLEIKQYHNIVLLSDAAFTDVQEADAQTLITLLHLNDISKIHKFDARIVSEILDVRNRELAEVTHADDFIVSENLASLLLTQISENKALGQVFRDLLSSEGSEIYLKSVADYIKTEQPINFYTLLEAAKRRNETAIGYQIMALSRSAADGYGVRLNPTKTEALTFTQEDRLIVLAEG